MVQDRKTRMALSRDVRTASGAPLLLAMLAVGVASLAPSCSDFGGLLPPDLPLEELLAVADTVRFHGSTFTLQADLWRDFMPGPDRPPEGRPLIGVIFVTATDSSALDAGLNADAIWLINVDKVWRSWLSHEAVPEDLLRQNRLVRYLRGGPTWGPSIAVEVVVRLVHADGTSAYLRAGEQWIWSTE